MVLFIEAVDARYGYSALGEIDQVKFFTNGSFVTRRGLTSAIFDRFQTPIYETLNLDDLYQSDEFAYTYNREGGIETTIRAVGIATVGENTIVLVSHTGKVMAYDLPDLRANPIYSGDFNRFIGDFTPANRKRTAHIFGCMFLESSGRLLVSGRASTTDTINNTTRHYVTLVTEPLAERVTFGNDSPIETTVISTATPVDGLGDFSEIPGGGPITVFGTPASGLFAKLHDRYDSADIVTPQQGDSLQLLSGSDVWKLLNCFDISDAGRVITGARRSASDNYFIGLALLDDAPTVNLEDIETNDSTPAISWSYTDENTVLDSSWEITAITARLSRNGYTTRNYGAADGLGPGATSFTIPAGHISADGDWTFRLSITGTRSAFGASDTETINTDITITYDTPDWSVSSVSIVAAEVDSPQGLRLTISGGDGPAATAYDHTPLMVYRTYNASAADDEPEVEIATVARTRGVDTVVYDHSLPYGMGAGTEIEYRVVAPVTGPVDSTDTTSFPVTQTVQASETVTAATLGGTAPLTPADLYNDDHRHTLEEHVGLIDRVNRQPHQVRLHAYATVRIENIQPVTFNEVLGNDPPVAFVPGRGYRQATVTLRATPREIEDEDHLAWVRALQRIQSDGKLLMLRTRSKGYRPGERLLGVVTRPQSVESHDTEQVTFTFVETVRDDPRVEL